MPRSTFACLLGLSLVVNVTLVTLVFWLARTRPKPEASLSLTSSLAAERAAAAKEAKKTESLLDALARGDSAALLAAGVSPDVVRHLAAAKAFARLRALVREDEARPSMAEYWRRPRAGSRRLPTREQRVERMTAERDFFRAMSDAFGEDWNDHDNGSGHTFLPPEKREKIRRIESDYEEMEREIAVDSELIQLPADAEKLRLLQAEKERDIAAILTPEEREQIELRTSSSAQKIISHYGDILASEDEYKRLYALQRAFDDRFSKHDSPVPPTPEEELRREEAERELNLALRAAIGEERWAAVSGHDREREVLDALTARLGIPAAASEQIHAVRDGFANLSIAIHRNVALTGAEREEQLSGLAVRARNELAKILGADGSEAYAQQSAWIGLLQNGSAFTTNARDLPRGAARPTGGSVFPLPSPAGGK